MSTVVTTLPPEDIGAALARAFQGWHVSNQAALGRTLTAMVVKASPSGSTVAAHIAATGAVQATPQSEPRAVLASSGNYEPLTINARGGSAHCATTLATIEGYYVPTSRYLRARSIFLAKLNAVKAGTVGALRPPPPQSLGASPEPFAAPPTRLFTDRFSALYRRCIELARKVDDATNASWRDPRSRVAVSAQFEQAVLELLYRV